MPDPYNSNPMSQLDPPQPQLPELPDPNPNDPNNAPDLVKQYGGVGYQLHNVMNDKPPLTLNPAPVTPQMSSIPQPDPQEQAQVLAQKQAQDAAQTALEVKLAQAQQVAAANSQKLKDLLNHAAPQDIRPLGPVSLCRRAGHGHELNPGGF